MFDGEVSSPAGVRPMPVAAAGGLAKTLAVMITWFLLSGRFTSSERGIKELLLNACKNRHDYFPN